MRAPFRYFGHRNVLRPRSIKHVTTLSANLAGGSVAAVAMNYIGGPGYALAASVLAGSLALLEVCLMTKTSWLILVLLVVASVSVLVSGAFRPSNHKLALSEVATMSSDLVTKQDHKILTVRLYPWTAAISRGSSSLTATFVVKAHEVR